MPAMMFESRRTPWYRWVSEGVSLKRRRYPVGADPIAARVPIVGYIGATSFSGSTLLSFLLNAQPGIVSIGELSWKIPKANPGKFICSCGASIDDCAFWAEVRNAMRRRGRCFDAEHWNTIFDIKSNDLLKKLAIRPLGNNLAENLRDTLVRGVPVWRAHLTDVGLQNAALIDSIAEVRGARVFVDASKDPIRARFLRAYSGLDLYVIHLVRDSPGFVNSFIKHVRRPAAFQSAIAWWNRTAGRMERIRAITPQSRWLLMRYEDLCTNPSQEIRRVLDFFGMSAVEPVLAFRSMEHHIIGNRMRLGQASEVRLDESWRANLSEEQLAIILKATHSLRMRLGYDERPG